MSKWIYPKGEHFVFESMIDTFVLECGITADDFKYVGEIMVEPKRTKTLYKVNFKKEVVVILNMKIRDMRFEVLE